MSGRAAPPPVVDVHIRPEDLRLAMEADVRDGLTADHKRLPPVYFYDDRGCALFEEITRLPEYYPTRAERQILLDHGPEIAERSGSDTLVELGAGVCDKSRHLLDAMAARGRLERFVPFDVSRSTMERAAVELTAEYPGLQVHAVVGTFDRHLGEIPPGGRRTVAFLGGTIGNLDPAERRRFLADLDCTMDHGDSLLIGTDLVKDVRTLVAAYDDSAGVTAEFNRNVLHVLNRELGATFQPDLFEHVARWNEEDSRIEMRLRATKPMTVWLRDLDLAVEFEPGEDLLTEISCKFEPAALEAELLACGFVTREVWRSAGGEFQVTLAAPYC